MEGNDNRKYAIYSRKSKFTGKGESIENQIELCKQFIQENHENVTVDEILIFEDEGFSGGNTNRPQFQKMMKEIEGKKIKEVVCYRMDRISRKVSDFSNLVEELGKLNVGFISINEECDTSRPLGRAMMMIAGVFSQLERETTAERIRDNMHELAKSGRWLGGTTPTGYSSTQFTGSTAADGRTRKAFKLDIIKEEAEIIKLIYAKFLEFNSLTKTETYLLQNHIQSKTKKSFSRFSIRAILQNPVYMAADEIAWNYFENIGVDIYAEKTNFDGNYGIMAYNKTIHKSGKANQIRDFSEWIVAVGKHKPIISSTDWVTVQNLLKQNKSKSYRKPKSNVALLSGLLFCGNCGDYMRPKLSSRLNEDGERIYSYLCETKEKSRCHNCNSKNPNGNTLDKAICEEIKKLSENSSEFIKQLERTEGKIANNQEEYGKQIENLQKNLQENEKGIKSLVTAVAKSEGNAAQSYYNEQINELDKMNEGIKKQIQELENMTQNRMLADVEFDVIRDLLKSFGTSFDTMSVEQKRAALRVFIKRIVWDGHDVHVYLFGSEEGSLDFAGLEEENLEPLRVGCK